MAEVIARWSRLGHDLGFGVEPASAGPPAGTHR
jgi:hypothetical protein